ncbi:septum formation initiator family protein [Qipengyuania oceanensis]
MAREGHQILTSKERRIQALALGLLLLMGGLAVAGPSGLLAWSENLRLLDERNQQIASLQEERTELKNRVALLDPNNADPDLIGELLRGNLNFVHPDEIVVTLEPEHPAE